MFVIRYFLRNQTCACMQEQQLISNQSSLNQKFNLFVNDFSGTVTFGGGA